MGYSVVKEEEADVVNAYFAKGLEDATGKYVLLVRADMLLHRINRTLF